MTYSAHDSRIVVVLIGVAALWRLIFSMPYYIPGDALSYLNGIDIYSAPLLGQELHIVRLGMVLPVAFLRWVGGDWHWLSMLYPLCASIGTCWVVFALANRWGGASAGYLGTGVIALVPMDVVYGTMLVPDTLLSFFGVAALWCVSNAQRDKASAWAFCAGLLVGLAYTCKVSGLFFAPLAMIHTLHCTRRIKSALAFVVGLGLVLLLEVLVLFLLMGEYHGRIAETLGFIFGDRGQFMHVEKTGRWWFDQIWFKVAAIFWLGHPPTALLLVVVPHLVALAVWRLLKAGRFSASAWLMAWGGVWIGQQMLISGIEPEPRYWHAALPYCAVLIGLGFGPLWDAMRHKWRFIVVKIACVISFVCSGIFWSTFSHTGVVTKLLAERMEHIEPVGDTVLLGGPTPHVMRLAHYRGVPTLLKPGDSCDLTHWARISNGYTIVTDESKTPPEGMERVFRVEAETPIPSLFEVLGYQPKIGLLSVAELYQHSASREIYPESKS